MRVFFALFPSVAIWATSYFGFSLGFVLLLGRDWVLFLVQLHVTLWTTTSHSTTDWYYSHLLWSGMGWDGVETGQWVLFPFLDLLWLAWLTSGFPLVLVTSVHALYLVV